MSDTESDTDNLSKGQFDSIEISSKKNDSLLYKDSEYYINCKGDKNLLLKLSIWICCVIIIICLELLYDRGYLSKDNPKYYRNENAFYDAYFRIITHAGGEFFIIFILLLSFFFLPLTKSNVMIVGVITCNYLVNVLKILYHENRPFWNFTSNITPPKCDMGFGNPSGHSFTSTFTYFAVYKFLSETQIFKNSTLLKCILLILSILITVSIYISRVYLNFHSIAQVLYGASLGFAVFAFLFYVIKLDNISIYQYRTFFTNGVYVLVFGVGYVMMLVVLVVVYLIMRRKQSGYENDENVNDCDKEKYRRFFHDGLFGGLTVVCLFGHYLGQVVFWKMVNMNKKFDNKEVEVNMWSCNRMHVVKDVKKILKVIGILLVSVIPMLLYVVVSSEDIGIVFALKIAIPFFLCIFDLYGLGLYMMLSQGCCNEKLL